MRWDAARAASRRELPKQRKMHGSVGRYQPAGQVGQCSAQEPDGTVWARGCQFCGVHVCHCKPVGSVSVSTATADKPDPGSELEKWCLLVAEAMKNASWFV